MAPTARMTLRVLVTKKENCWVAQCLDFDIVAQAQGTFEDIKAEFCRTVSVRLAACEQEGVDPFKLPPAPENVHRLFESAQLQAIADDDCLPLPPAFIAKGLTASEIRCRL